jgi:predicted TIM-barrel fold metal-dependent hydrolase
MDSMPDSINQVWKNPLDLLARKLGNLRGNIIDMHIHPTTNERDMRAMLEQARRAGISHLIISNAGIPSVPLHATESQVTRFNEFSARLCDRFPNWIDMFVYIDSQDPDAAVREIDSWVLGHGAVGIKIEWGRGDGDDLTCADTVVRRAAELGVPVKFHTFFRKGGALPREVTPLHIAKLAKAHPDAKIIMAHSGGDWIRAARTVKHLANVYSDTSGCTWRSGFTEFLVHNLGPDRVLYGSDMPCRAFGPQIAKVLAANLSRDNLHMIFVDNAQRLFFKRKHTNP